MTCLMLSTHHQTIEGGEMHRWRFLEMVRYMSPTFGSLVIFAKQMFYSRSVSWTSLPG